MIQEKLYELAFRYKETKLWKKLYDTQIFAFRQSNGRIGYLSIMGKCGEHCALALYIGDEGFQSYRNLLQTDAFDRVERLQLLFSQKCLQCEFTTKEYLTEEEYKEVKAYAQKHQIRFAGKNAYPRFMKYDPEYIPWPLQSDAEQTYLTEALSAAIEMNRLLEDSVPPPEDFMPETSCFPFFELQDGAFVYEFTKVPDNRGPKFPRPALDEINATRLKKLKKDGVWECKVVRIPDPIQNQPQDVPALPVLVLACELNSGDVFTSMPALHYSSTASELLKHFVEQLLIHEIRPREIRVFDNRSKCFFDDLCSKTGISLKLRDQPELLDEVEQDLLGHIAQNRYDDDENDEMIDEMMDEMIDAVLHMNRRELQELPPVLIGQLLSMADAGILPPAVAKELKRKLDF